MATHRSQAPSGLAGLGARVTWLGLKILAQVTDIPRAVREATGRERARMVESALSVLCAVLVVALSAWPAWTWLLPVLFVLRGLADLDDIYRAIGWRQKMERLLERQPTGAPRYANLACANGYTHRFFYGEEGWEEAGPAVHEEPTQHAAYAPVDA